MLAVGKGNTVIFTLSLLLHPSAFVAEIVKVVVVVGEAVTFPLVLLFKFAMGFHEYVKAPEAVNAAEFPEHKVKSADFTIMGKEFTNIGIVVISVHPLLFVPITE